MNLQQFVKESLLQVIGGVTEAQDEAPEKPGKINPLPDSYGVNQSAGLYQGTTIQHIDFDVAVTVSEGTQASGGLTVLGMGAKGGITESSSYVSRLKFRVPVALPPGKED